MGISWTQTMIVSSFSCTLKYVCSTGFDRSALCLRSPYVRVRCRRWAQCRGHAAGYLGLVGCAPGQGWLPSFRVVCSSRTGLHLSPCYHVVSELGCSSHLPLPAFFYLPSSPAHWLALSRCYSLTRYCLQAHSPWPPWPAATAATVPITPSSFMPYY
jgi:hypothetical protein